MIEHVRINENLEANSKKSAPLPRSPLLLTESADEFEAVRDSLEREIKPRGILEEIYVAEISSMVWEILRLRRCKVTVINAAFRSALETVLTQFMLEPGQHGYEVQDEAKTLAHDWFTDRKAKIQVSDILDRFGLDESAIEAEAIRKSSSELELLDIVGIAPQQSASLYCRISLRPS